MKRKLQTDKVLGYVSKEETLAGAYKDKRKKSQWKRCFSGWQRKKIQPAPLKPLNEPVRSASTDLTCRNTGESKQGSCCSQETPSTTSASASVGADLKSSQLVLLDYVEDEDETSQDNRNVVSSLSSTSSILPDDQVTFSKVKFLKEPPVVETTTDEFKEEMSTSITHQPINFGDDEETAEKKRNRFSRFTRNIFSKVRMH